MASEAVAERGVDAPDIAIPRCFAASAVIYVRKELLVPTNGGKKLGCDFVFRFEIVRERVGVADIWDLKSGEENLAPELPMPPLVADVFSESDLVVVADVFAGGKIRTLFSNRKEVSAVTERR